MSKADQYITEITSKVTAIGYTVIPEKCDVYLSDISTGNRKGSDQSSEDTWEQAFKREDGQRHTKLSVRKTKHTPC
jgi:hypothetical protein